MTLYLKSFAFVFIFSETNGHTFEIKYLPYPPTSKYWSSTNDNFEAGLQNIYAAEIIWKAVFSEYCWSVIFGKKKTKTILRQCLAHCAALCHHYRRLFSCLKSQTNPLEQQRQQLGLPPQDGSQCKDRLQPFGSWPIDLGRTWRCGTPHCQGPWLTLVLHGYVELISRSGLCTPPAQRMSWLSSLRASAFSLSTSPGTGLRRKKSPLFCCLCYWLCIQGWEAQWWCLHGACQSQVSVGKKIMMHYCTVFYDFCLKGIKKQHIFVKILMDILIF